MGGEQEERREDYISIKELFKASIVAKGDITHMKKSIDEIKETQKETNKSVDKVSEKFDQFLDMHTDLKETTNILKFKFNLMLTAIGIFFSAIIGGIALFKAKLIALVALL